MTGEPPEASGLLILSTDDLLIVRRVRQLAAANALAVSDAGGDGDAAQPVVAVIDLGRPQALEQLRDWRARWPDALLAAFVSEPDRDRWLAAQRAGCDLVVNRGALLPRLRDWLSRRAAAGHQPAARRFPLLDAADVAGRLGLVHATDDTPVGPLAVYQVAGHLYGVADRCPHAGAVLSGGEVEAGVVTCPAHGSRFDVRTGERVRGPADAGITCYRLVQEGGQVFLVLPG